MTQAASATGYVSFSCAWIGSSRMTSIPDGRLNTVLLVFQKAALGISIEIPQTTELAIKQLRFTVCLKTEGQPLLHVPSEYHKRIYMSVEQANTLTLRLGFIRESNPDDLLFLFPSCHIARGVQAGDSYQMLLTAEGETAEDNLIPGLKVSLTKTDSIRRVVLPAIPET